MVCFHKNKGTFWAKGVVWTTRGDVPCHACISYCTECGKILRITEFSDPPKLKEET